MKEYENKILAQARAISKSYSKRRTFSKAKLEKMRKDHLVKFFKSHGMDPKIFIDLV